MVLQFWERATLGILMSNSGIFDRVMPTLLPENKKKPDRNSPLPSDSMIITEISLPEKPSLFSADQRVACSLFQQAVYPERLVTQQ
jgi:hypothetical protein